MPRKLGVFSFEWNITKSIIMAQVLRSTFLLSATLAVAACGSRASSSLMIPVDPQVTVTRFMSAVEANNLLAMAELWGTKDGPSLEEMDRTELEMRLTVMQSYLSHDEYEVLAGLATFQVDQGTRAYRIRLTRAGCVHNVPFELVRVGGAWLVSSVDIAQAGNPARACGQGGTLRDLPALVIP